MSKLILLLIPLILVILTSGCTIPGTNILVPVPWGTTVEYENDIVVLRDVRVYPNQLSPVQDARVIAYVQNLGSKELEVKVKLYDYCSGLFDKVANDEQPVKLLPGETSEVVWDLKAPADRKNNPSSFSVRQDCTVKLYVRYKTAFEGITTVHFIDPQEYRSRIERGTYQEITSYMAAGEGPLKAYLTVEDKQPFPAESGDSVTFGLQLINRGRGFVYLQPTEDLTTKISFEPAYGLSLTGQKIKMLGRESNKAIMQAPVSGFNLGTGFIETTKQISTEIKEYWYEFRQEATVSVVPQM